MGRLDGGREVGRGGGDGALTLPLSRAVVAEGLVFVSGQGPFEPKTKRIPEAFEDQARLTLENVERVLHAAEVVLEDVVKVNVFLKYSSRLGEFNAVYREFFPRNFLARTTIGTNLCEIRWRSSAWPPLPTQANSLTLGGKR